MMIEFKYFELLTSFIGAAISYRVPMSFNWLPLGIDVTTNSLELRWAVHYKYNTIRFTTDVGPDEEDYVFNRIANHISTINAMKHGA